MKKVLILFVLLLIPVVSGAKETKTKYQHTHCTCPSGYEMDVDYAKDYVIEKSRFTCVSFSKNELAKIPADEIIIYEADQEILHKQCRMKHGIPEPAE